MKFAPVLMDLILPEEEIIIETQKNFPDVPVILAAVVAVFAAILIIKTIKKKK